MTLLGPFAMLRLLKLFSLEAILWLVNAFWFLLTCVSQLLGEHSANTAPGESGICLSICFFFYIFPLFCVKRDKRLSDFEGECSTPKCSIARVFPFKGRVVSGNELCLSTALYKCQISAEMAWDLRTVADNSINAGLAR